MQGYPLGISKFELRVLTSEEHDAEDSGEGAVSRATPFAKRQIRVRLRKDSGTILKASPNMSSLQRERDSSWRLR